MTQILHRSLLLKGPAGRLEALLWNSPQPDPPLVAVACHPHPLYGGTMHNKVVFRVAKTLARLGLPVLRFNFRGTGMSQGTHDYGRGEADDVRTALTFLAEQFHGQPQLLAGFSFGAWVGLQVGCADARVAELVGLGLPANDTDFSFLRNCPKPKLLLQGDRDQFGAHETLQALVADVRGPQSQQTTLVFVPDGDHFFTGKLTQVDRALEGWLKARYPELTAMQAAPETN